MGFDKLARPLERCLIVLDDLLATDDLVIPHIFPIENTSQILVITRQHEVAQHYSEKQENIYELKGLEYRDTQSLLTAKVFKKTINLAEQYPELVEEAKVILRKCKGIPLAIVTMSKILGKQNKLGGEVLEES